MALTREQIERADDAKIIKAQAWGNEVCVRLMTVGDRDSYELLLVESGGKAPPDFRSELVARTLCDEKGNLLFPGDEGVKEIKKRSADEIHKLWLVAMKHNALSDEEIKRLAGE